MLCGEIYLCLQFEVSEFPTFFSNYNVRLYPVSSRAPLSPTLTRKMKTKKNHQFETLGDRRPRLRNPEESEPARYIYLINLIANKCIFILYFSIKIGS